MNRREKGNKKEEKKRFKKYGGHPDSSNRHVDCTCPVDSVGVQLWFYYFLFLEKFEKYKFM